MERPAVNPKTVQFGLFEVDLQARELRKSGVKIKLNEQPFQVLTVLLERPGEVITREELQTRLWPADTFVDFDLSLNGAVKKLRTALGDESDNPRFVETLYRRGYRFIAPVSGQVANAGNGAGSLPADSLRSEAPTMFWRRLAFIAGSGLAVLLAASRSRSRRGHRREFWGSRRSPAAAKSINSVRWLRTGGDSTSRLQTKAASRWRRSRYRVATAR